MEGNRNIYFEKTFFFLNLGIVITAVLLLCGETTCLLRTQVSSA